MLDSERSAEEMEMQLANLAAGSVDGGLGPNMPLEHHIVIPTLRKFAVSIHDVMVYLLNHSNVG